jgi:hypothetical protein
MQIKINHLNDIVPYAQLNNIVEMGDDGFTKIYIAKCEHNKNSDKTVIVKYIYNLQNSVNEFLNKVRKFSIM